MLTAEPCGQRPFVGGEAAPRLGDVAGAFGLGFGPGRGERFAEPGDAAMAAPAAEHRELEDAGGLAGSRAGPCRRRRRDA